jgi:hypothetical protein
MSIEKTAPEAFEWSARALYEEGRGAGSWTKASAQDRGAARQSVRIVLGMLTKHGVVMSPGAPESSAKPVSKPASKPAGKPVPPMW